MVCMCDHACMKVMMDGLLLSVRVLGTTRLGCLGDMNVCLKNFHQFLLCNRKKWLFELSKA